MKPSMYYLLSLIDVYYVRMKALPTTLLLVLLGLGIPTGAAAQSRGFTTGRAASQKHNRRLSRKDVKAHRKALRKQLKRGRKASRKTHHQNG
jgi:hypothetical protein